MDSLSETIELDLEENNELAFKIKVEGASASPARVRLVCEGADLSYMFNGHGTGEDGIVQFVMPQMKDRLTEGLYQARVEVLIDNRFFSPVQFQINFKKTMKVVAEAVSFGSRFKKQEISVTATPVVVNRPQPVIQPKQSISKPIVIEEIKVQKPHVAPNVIPKKAVTPNVGEDMPSARASASKTLRERYENKPQEQPTNKFVKPTKIDDEDEESRIRQLARSILRGMK